MTAALLTPRFDVPTASLGLPSEPPLVQFVGESSLIDALSEVRGARIITVEARTEPRLLAKHPQTCAPNPLRGNVVKVAKVNGMVGWQYASSVKEPCGRRRDLVRARRRRLPFLPRLQPKCLRLPKDAGRRAAASPAATATPNLGEGGWGSRRG